MQGRLLRWAILVSCVASGCNLRFGSASASNPEAWFDQPRPGSSFPLGPVAITAHGSSSGGITSFEFSVNGSSSLFPSPSTSDSLVTFTHTWIPDQPGTYNLSLRSLGAGGDWSAPANTTVIILGGATASPTGPTPASTGTPSPTATFTPTVPPAAAAGSIEFTGRSTDALYYGAGRCGTQEISLQVRATHPAGITVVVLFYRLESRDGSATDFLSKAMSPAGADMFQTTVNPNSDFGLATLNSLDDGWFEYQAVIQDKTGGTKTRTSVVSDVTFGPCGGGGPPPGRRQPTAVPTNTPIIPH